MRGMMTVKNIESIAQHPAVSLMMAEIVALFNAINSNVVQPGHKVALYSSQSIEPIAVPEILVVKTIFTESPSRTVLSGPKSRVTKTGSWIVNDCTNTQPLASVTVNPYVPGDNDEIVEFPGKLPVHEYV